MRRVLESKLEEVEKAVVSAFPENERQGRVSYDKSKRSPWIAAKGIPNPVFMNGWCMDRARSASWKDYYLA
ncbi:hypothetical protein HZH66_009086 [Vespula vulgaris]|uniref:Uncharacterized protein n=1 Tax=Vespula vulgaris TaxID=7454 RepID=A0A834JQU6_VESVU|nr:hypothetical protein HZH66_009086 [Vespula vulgaris]